MTVVSGHSKSPVMMRSTLIILSCQDIYVFKKAFFLVRALSKRFATVSPLPFPIPNTDNIPVMADNVVPSMLIHLGVINVGMRLFPSLNVLLKGSMEDSMDHPIVLDEGDVIVVIYAGVMVIAS